MAKYINIDCGVGTGYLSDWYQNSIMGDVPPIWTDEHIEELANDFFNNSIRKYRESEC